MSDDRDCHIGELDLVLAVLRGNEGFRPRRCSGIAAHSTQVTLSRPGQAIDVYTQLCDDHDRQAHDIPGYARSVKLRPSSTT